MQIYSDLIVTGNENALAELLSRLDESGGKLLWQRDPDVESQMGITVFGGVLRGYKCSGKDVDTPVHLWLDIAPRELKVTNIVPDDQPQLTYEEYFRLLMSFRKLVLQIGGDLPIQVSEPILDLAPAALLTDSGYRLLRAFSTLANKSTGVSQPRDRQRWNAFIIELHRRRIRVGADDLIRVLVEHEHWPEQKASELALLFESEQSLLSDLAETA